MKTILIMEDDPYQSRLMQRLLERADYHILVESDGESGLQTAMTVMPDLILLDMGLPDLDGQTVAALLKGSEALSKIPVVVVTAWPQETAAAIARAYGCDGYISKPVNAREFADQIAKYFKPDPPAE
ncbi:MAG TPA: response regulator [Anaerolineae bacterium]|nr:response regulator [Anaerolineae bacterium]HQK13061.1 response regulator [Anaerolineae bacterium]